MTENIQTFTSFAEKADALDAADAETKAKEAPSAEKTDEKPEKKAESKEKTKEEAENAKVEKIMRKHKVKLDGKELEVDEDELIRNYQLRKVSDQRLQEATQARKQAEEFIRILKQDPRKVLADPRIGVDLRKFAEDYLLEQLQNESLTPEQKELKKAKDELKQYEQWKREQEEAGQRAQAQALEAHYTQKYQQDIIGALEKAQLPKTEGVVARMIHYMSQALENNYELSADEVTDLVRKDYINDTKALYASVPDSLLLDILGDDVVKKVVKADLAKVRKGSSPQSKVEPSEPKERKTKSDRVSMDDWKARMERIKQGLE